MTIKYQSDVQSFLYQLNTNDQVNEQARYRGTYYTTIVKVYPQNHQLYP